MIPSAEPEPIRLLLVSPRRADARRLDRLLGSGEAVLRRAPTVARGLRALRAGAADVLLCDAGTWLRRPSVRPGPGPVVLLADGANHSGQLRDGGAVVDTLHRSGLGADRLRLSLGYAARCARLNRGLAEIQDELNVFFRQAPCAVCIFGADGKVRFSNELFRERLKGLPPGPRPRLTPPGQPWSHFDGKRHWLVSSFEIKDRGAGARRGLAAFELTTRIDLEMSRERQNQLISALLQRLPIVVGRLDRRRVSEASGNPGSARGLAPDHILGRSLAQLHPEARDVIDRALAGQPAECVIQGRGRDGRWYAEFVAYPDPNEPDTAMFVARDVTERRRLERRLLGASEAEQRRLGSDLHDDLGPHLTGTACLAGALRDRLAAAGSA